MGGDVNHEFMAVAAVGEDDFVWCKACDYAANVEAARRRRAADAAPPAGAADQPAMEEVHTPDLRGHRGRRRSSSKVEPSTMLKAIAFDVDGELGLAVVPGDREVNEFALAAALAPAAVRLFDDDDFAAHPELPKGYIGVHNEHVSVVVADPSVRCAGSAGSPGANESITTRGTRCSAATSTSTCGPTS